MLGGGVFGGVVPLAGALYAVELEDDGAGWGPVALADFAVAAADEVFAAISGDGGGDEFAVFVEEGGVGYVYVGYYVCWHWFTSRVV